MYADLCRQQRGSGFICDLLSQIFGLGGTAP